MGSIDLGVGFLLIKLASSVNPSLLVYDTVHTGCARVVTHQQTAKFNRTDAIIADFAKFPLFRP